MQSDMWKCLTKIRTVLLILKILSAVGVSLQAALEIQNEFRVSRFNTCPDYEDTIVQLKDLNILSLVDKIVVNGELVVTEDITGKLLSELAISRCDLPRTHCEDIDTHKLSNACEQIKAFTVLGTTYMDGIVPTLDCPPKKGTYKLNNMTFDLQAALKLPIGGYHWPADFKLKDEKNKLLYCAVSEVTIKSARKRSAKPAKSG